MESKNESKNTDIKNLMCYSFDDIRRVEDIDFDDILLRRKII